MAATCKVIFGNWAERNDVIVDGSMTLREVFKEFDLEGKYGAAYMVNGDFMTSDMMGLSVAHLSQKYGKLFLIATPKCGDVYKQGKDGRWYYAGSSA